MLSKLWWCVMVFLLLAGKAAARVGALSVVLDELARG